MTNGVLRSRQDVLDHLRERTVVRPAPLLWVVACFLTGDGGPGSDPGRHFFTQLVSEADCWLWQGATGGGYGQIWATAINPRRPTRTHIAGYLLLVGEIPEGFHLHHLCGQTLCWNPAHLELVTPRQHVRRHWPEVCPRGHAPNWHISKKGSRVCRTCDSERNRLNRRRPPDGQ